MRPGTKYLLAEWELLKKVGPIATSPRQFKMGRTSPREAKREAKREMKKVMGR